MTFRDKNSKSGALSGKGTPAHSNQKLQPLAAEPGDFLAQSLSYSELVMECQAQQSDIWHQVPLLLQPRII